MNYEFCYELLTAPEPHINGTGCVIHDIRAVCREEGQADGWAVVPGYQRGVPVPSDELKAVMDMPHNTGPEKQAKNTAYKGLLASHIGDLPAPWGGGWSAAQLEIYMDTNDAATLEAQRANDYLTVVLEQSYPVRFTL